MRYLLDSGPLTAYLRGRQGAIARFGSHIQQGDVATSILNYKEAVQMSEYTWQRQTIHGTLDRIRQEPEYPWVAIGDFVDDWHRSALEDRLELVSMGIPEVETDSAVFRWAVFCAAMVEWLCLHDHLPVPDWTQDGYLQLPDPWYLYPGELEQMKSWQRETTPPSFAKRNIYGGDKILSRV